MVDNAFIGIENAVTSGTTFRRDYTTSTPSQQTGYEATYLRDQHLGKRWRGATADVRYTPLLARFDDVYRVGAPSGLGHNLSPSATWRATLGTTGSRPAVRSTWRADGVDDYGLSATTLPDAATFTLLARLYIPPPSIAQETSYTPLIRIWNGVGERLRICAHPANVSSPLAMSAQVRNFSSFSEVSASSVISGAWVDFALRYRTSDDAVQFYIDGVLAAAGTATAPWADQGDVKIEIARVTANYVPCLFMDIAIYDRWDDVLISGYEAQTLDGTERGLVAAWQDWTTSTVSDVVGNADIVLTGGTYSDKADISSLHTTGILEAVGQWYRRKGLRISAGTSVATTSAIATAPRDLTMSFMVNLTGDHVAGTDTEIFAYGPTYANGEGVVSLDSSGQIVITSNRGTPDTVTSATIRDLGPVRGRLVLQSVDSTTSNLSLYLGTGTTAEALVGTVQVGPYDALASCKVLIGDVGAGSDNSNCILGEARVFGAVRLEAVDNLSGKCDLSDPDLIECLVFDSEVVSDVVVARAYSTASLTYESIDNPNVTRSAPGREGLGYPYTSGRAQIESELLAFVADADIEVSEIFLEIWDRKNADGYVSLGALCCWATFRPAENRVTGSELTWKMRKALRTDVEGIPYREDTYEAPVGKISLKYLDIIDEQHEVYRRVLRARRDKLVLLATEPRRLVGQTKTATPQYLFVDYFVVGTLTATTDTIKEGNERHVEIELEVEGVRRQTA